MQVKCQIEELYRILENIDVKNHYDAEFFCRKLSSFINKIEDKLALVGLEYEIEVHIDGPYGATRWLCLEDHDYYNIQAGQWQSSAQSC